MKIAICVKWVPALARMHFDPATRRIVREGVPHELNSYDQLAVQRAVELKGERGDVEITALTMGPPQARQGLIQCLALGVDHAVHITDRAFAGSDTLATARALALALRREAYDLLLFGNHSLDAETGQVGPEVAELLGMPQITNVRRLDLTEDGVRVEREMEEGLELIDCPLPCVIAVTEGVAPERPARREAIIEARGRAAQIVELTAADLSSDPQAFGDAGSPTWVSEIRFVESSREQVLIDEDVPPEAASRQVVAYIESRGLLAREARLVRSELRAAPVEVRPADGPAVWAVAELGRRGLKAVSFELVGAAQPVAEEIQGHVAALLFGGEGVDRYAADLAAVGADVVYVQASRALASYATGPHSAALASAIQSKKPFAVLLPSTVNGRDYAARVAARLQLGLTGDAVGLEVDGDGRLIQLKPAFGGNVVAPIYSKTLPNMVTVRPGLLEPLGRVPERRVPVITLVDPVVPEDRVCVRETRYEEGVDTTDLDNAWCTVALGMGLGGPEHIGEFAPLLDLLQAEIITTRDVVEAGWLPRQRQVGITGRSVAPALYLAFGVRGDFNHMVGIQRAGTVVAVNSNRRASIFRQADIGVVAEWQAILPALVEELRRHMGAR